MTYEEFCAGINYTAPKRSTIQSEDMYNNTKFALSSAK